MNEEINTISEEQVLHNKLSFEINQELIHLMKRIVELQQENARLKDKNDKIEKWLKYKAEALDTFDIPKRKETGAFWFATRGEIDGLLELLKEN